MDDPTLTATLEDLTERIDLGGTCTLGTLVCLIRDGSTPPERIDRTLLPDLYKATGEIIARDCENKPLTDRERTLLDTTI